MGVRLLPVGKGNLMRGNGRQMGCLKVALPSLGRHSSETLPYVHPRHKVSTHANDTTADANELV